MKLKILIPLLLIVVLLVAGCVGNSEGTSERKLKQVLNEDGLIVMRFHDNELSTTCWVTTRFKGDGGWPSDGGISCIPDSQLSVTKE